MPHPAARPLTTAVVLAAALSTAACATEPGAARATATAHTVTGPSATAGGGPESRCRDALDGAALVAWVDSTAGDLRAYQYSGPTPHRPLRAAFPGAPDDAPGAWCAVALGADSARWIGVVPGYAAVTAITVNGPDAGLFRGTESQGPIIP